MSLRLPHEDSPLDAPPLAGMASILVVDEDPAFQLGLKTFLREYVGFERVFTARSGQEALDFVRTDPSIEVLTLDYRMPGMNGIEVLSALRTQITRPLAVLMITGHASDELEAEFKAQGNDCVLATHFLTKPVQFEKLEPVVLAAHEEVIAAKRRERDREHDPAVPVDESVSAEVFSADFASRLDIQSERLAELDRELKAQQKKWRADFWKIAFAMLLFWLAGQFGLLKRLEPHWANIKGKVWHQVDLWKATRDASRKPTKLEPSPAPATEVAPGQAL